MFQVGSQKCVSNSLNCESSSGSPYERPTPENVWRYRMKRTLFIAVAAAGLAFTAAPAYAQSSSGGSSGGSFGNSGFGNSTSTSSSKARVRAQRRADKERKRAAKIEAERKALFEREERARQATAAAASPSSATGQTVFKNEKALLAKDEPVRVDQRVTQLPANCPAGTIAQSNGTCMLQ